MGTVLRRPGGRVVIQWVDGSGRKRQRTVKRRRADGSPLSIPAREKEARRLLAELEDQAERQRIGLAPRPLANERVTFGELHDFWEATRGASVRSRAFIDFVRPHVAELFPLPVADVTTARIDRLLTAKAARLADKSLMHVRGHLHSVFEAGRVQGGPWEGRANPVNDARRFKVAEKSVQLITPAEWPLLAGEVPERWRGQVAVAFFTGLRRGDVFGIRKRDVDLARGVIAATISKAKKARTLPIADELRPYLEAAVATPGPMLFDWPRGKRLPNLVKMLRRACGRAGLITGHELRCRAHGCRWSEERGGVAVPEVPEACPRCGRDTGLQPADPEAGPVPRLAALVRDGRGRRGRHRRRAGAPRPLRPAHDAALHAPRRHPAGLGRRAGVRGGEGCTGAASCGSGRAEPRSCGSLAATSGSRAARTRTGMPGWPAEDFKSPASTVSPRPRGSARAPRGG
jgi:integrase